MSVVRTQAVARTRALGQAAEGTEGGRGEDAAAGGAWLAWPAALVHLTAVLALGLFLEVVAAMRPLLGTGGNPWAWLPVVYLPLAYVLALLVQLYPGRDQAHAFGAAMALGVVVGVVGTALHMAAHGLLGPHWQQWLRFGSWMGDPPVFAPMSFALLGLAGTGALLAAPVATASARKALGKGWEHLGDPPGSARATSWAAALLGLGGLALEATPARAWGVLAVMTAALLQSAGMVIAWRVRTGWKGLGRHAARTGPQAGGDRAG